VNILGQGIPDMNDPRWVGLIDAEQSGWFLNNSDEVFRGFHIAPSDYVLDVGCGSASLMAESVAQSALMNSPNQIEAVMENFEKRMPKFSDPT